MDVTWLFIYELFRVCLTDTLLKFVPFLLYWFKWDISKLWCSSVLGIWFKTMSFSCSFSVSSSNSKQITSDLLRTAERNVSFNRFRWLPVFIFRSSAASLRLCPSSLSDIWGRSHRPLAVLVTVRSASRLSQYWHSRVETLPANGCSPRREARQPLSIFPCWKLASQWSLILAPLKNLCLPNHRMHFIKPQTVICFF